MLATTTPEDTMTDAFGPATVASAHRPECHAPSGYSLKSFSAKPAASGVSPRERQTAMILAYWESIGIARYNRRNGGIWEARDVVNGGTAWHAFGTGLSDDRSATVEISHVVSADNGGAYCACNTLPEIGAANAARGNDDIDVNALSSEAHNALDGWRGYWLANVARSASVKRLAADGQLV